MSQLCLAQREKKNPMLSSCGLERAFPAPSARQKCKACCDLDLGSLLLFIREVSSRQGAGEEPEGEKSCWSAEDTGLKSSPPAPLHSPGVSGGFNGFGGCLASDFFFSRGQGRGSCRMQYFCQKHSAKRVGSISQAGN